MKNTLLFICLSVSLLVFSQNLVPNPSFETFTNCPQGPGAFDGNVQWWSTPDTATPDYYNTCYTPLPPPFPAGPSMGVPSNIQGFQNARTGNGYAGLISADNSLSINANYREYIQVQLTQPLVAGTEYCVEFFWSLADVSPHFVNEIGVYFSPTQIFLQQSTALPFTPQLEQTGTPLNDTTNWVPFLQNYVATGGERYMIIGNFRNPANTTLGTTGIPCDIISGGCFAYYYIDDVKVEEGLCCLKYIDPVNDLCTTDASITLTAQTPGGVWSSIPATPALNATSGVFNPALAAVNSYSIIYTLACGSDTINLSVNDCSALNVCAETNGDLTVSGGTGPYTWEYLQAGGSVTITNQSTCEACGYSWNAFVSECFNPFPIPATSCNVPDTWVSFGNGATITIPAGRDTVRVTDNAGTIYTIFDVDTISSCDENCTTPVLGTDVRNVCGTSFTWIDGIQYITNNSTATFTLISGASNGCDSIVTLNLTFSATQNSIDVRTACNSFTWIDGITYNSSTNTPSFTIAGGASSGCDSVVTLNLTIGQPTSSTLNEQICDGEAITIDGTDYTTAGNYTITLPNSSGCDSVISLNLTVISAIGSSPANGFFNTATNGSGGTLPGGSNDLLWQVTRSSTGGNINGPYVPATVMTVTPATYFTSPWPDAGWISHQADGGHLGDEDFFYRAQFDLACTDLCGGSFADPNTFCLNLDFYVDNTIIDIFINGVSQAASISQIPGGSFLAGGELNLSLCNNWQPGANEIIVHVFSGEPFAGFLAQTSINPPPTPTDTINESICNGDTYIFNGNGLTSAGTYTETFTNTLGCDSIVTLILSINNPTSGTDQQIACNSFTWIDGVTYNSSTNSPTFTIVGGAANSCDSIVTLNLTINTSDSTFRTLLSCSPADTGFFTFSNLNQFGCDSIYTTQVLLQSSSITSSTQTLCTGDSIIWNGQTITSGGNYYNSSSATDSIFPKVNNNTPQPLGTTGPSYPSYGFSTPALYSDYTNGGAPLPDGSANGFTYEYLTDPFWTGNGVVADRITSILGKWIVGPYNVNTWYGGSATINVPTTQTYYILLAADNEFRFSLNGNIVISSDGNAILASQPGGNADQVAFRRVHIYPLEIPAGCQVITLEALDYGGAAMLAGAILNNTELEIINATSINDLNFIFSTQDETNFYSGTAAFSCPSGSIELGSSNCDSCQILVCGDVEELIVTEVSTTNSIDNVIACDSYTWIDGITYTNSTNIPTFTIVGGSSNSCDSIITLNLTINNSSTSSSDSTTCNPADIGVFVTNGTNQFGCDSTHTLTVTLSPSLSIIDTQTACNSFTWIDGITYNASTNTPIFILSGAPNNCDTLVTLNLTINTTQTGVDNQIACESYTWIDGVNYTSSTNTPTFTIANGAANGCDSIVTLNLSINVATLPTFDSIADVCNGDILILPNVSTNGVNGTWSPAIDNTNTTNYLFTPTTGTCATTADLTVTVLPTDTGYISQITCFAADTGTTTFTFTNQFGCDSVIFLSTVLSENIYSVNPDFAVVAGGESFEFTINNEDDNLEFSYIGNNGENCETPCNNFTLNPNDYTVLYFFTLIDTSTGCLINDTLRLDVEYNSELNAPNIFTPNGDGQNDIYRAYGKDIFEYSLIIFDRWGGKLFETIELTEGWDGNFKGQPVQSGVYLGLIEATGLDAKKYKFSVNIKLVR